MANDRKSEYTIELEIKAGDKTRSNVADIENSLKKLGDSARDGLSDGLADASKQADALIGKIKDLAKSSDDVTREMVAYNRESQKTVSALEKQATTLIYSMGEAGKAQRERLAALKNELEALGKSKSEQKRRKDIEKEIKQIEKNIYTGTDAELKSALDNNRAIRAKLKLLQDDTKLLQAQAKEQKTLKTLVKDDLKAIKEKIKAQFKFIEALKTTEGKYKAIKKAAGFAAKGVGIAGAGILGGAIAAGGMAVASADRYVEREREAKRIKAAMSDDEKNMLVGEMYIKTGADYKTIVDAINRVTSVLGIHDRDGIASAAAAEIRYPGAAAMFRQQTTGAATGEDFSRYAGRMQAIQSATGATAEDITASTEKIANMRQRSFSNASMTDLQTVYLALQQSGAYDKPEELDRAFSTFVRRQMASGKNVFDFAQEYFGGAGATRGVYGAQNRQQAIKAISNIDWARVSTAAGETRGLTQTEAEKTVEAMRMFEETKNKILLKILQAIEPLMDELLKSGKIEKIANGLISFLSDAVPLITEVVTQIAKGMGLIGDALDGISAQNEESARRQVEAAESGDTGKIIAARGGFDHPRFANGGITSMPSICGERGPEMVIPMDYSRAARSSNLTQNLIQNFSMHGNETTALSLSQAVKSRDFTRAMMSNSYINTRLGR